MEEVISSVFLPDLSYFILSFPSRISNFSLFPPEVFSFATYYSPIFIYVLLPVMLIYACKCFICIANNSTSSWSSPFNKIPSFITTMHSSSFIVSFSSSSTAVFFFSFFLASWFYVLLFITTVFSVAVNLIFTYVTYPFKYVNENLYEKYLDVFTSKVYNFSAFLLISFYPFWSIQTVRQPPKGYKCEGSLIMSNHVSTADGFILLSKLFPWSVKVVYKASLQKVLIFGASLKISRQVAIYFTKEKNGWGTEAGSVQKSMERSLQLLNSSCSLLVFPEGTRNENCRMEDMKNGFFKFAIQHNKDILPMVIHNSQESWPSGSAMPKIATVYIAFGNPIKTKGYQLEDLKFTVRKQMLELLAICPSFDESMHMAGELRKQRKEDKIF